jgi:hypothetical protein
MTSTSHRVSASPSLALFGFSGAGEANRLGGPREIQDRNLKLLMVFLYVEDL